LLEEERRPDGKIEQALTVFLTGAECPFTCSFCDLWQWTIDGPTPPGALTSQLESVLQALDGPVPDRERAERAGVGEGLSQGRRRVAVQVVMDTATLLGLAEHPAELVGYGIYRGLIGHIDKNVDPYVHRDLAARGVFLEYDGPSRLKYGPDSAVVKLISSAADGGYGDQILLGMDLARRSYYPSYGGGPGLGYLLGVFVPRLGAEGLGDMVHRIFVDLGVNSRFARELTELFARAKFSQHRIDQPMKENAIQLLETIRAGLREDEHSGQRPTLERASSRASL